MNRKTRKTIRDAEKGKVNGPYSFEEFKLKMYELRDSVPNAKDSPNAQTRKAIRDAKKGKGEEMTIEEFRNFIYKV